MKFIDWHIRAESEQYDLSIEGEVKAARLEDVAAASGYADKEEER